MAKTAPAKAPTRTAPKAQAKPKPPVIEDDLDLSDEIEEAPARDVPGQQVIGEGEEVPEDAEPTEGADEAAEGDDGLGDDDEVEEGDEPAPEEEEVAEGDDEAEEEAEAPVEAAPAPKGKKAPAAKPAPAPAAPAEEEGLPYAAGYEVLEAPVADLKPGKIRDLPEGAVEEMAKSIKLHGLQNPIVVGTDNVIIQGRTRYAAYELLKRKTIPIRIAVNPKTGEAISSKDAEAMCQGVIENLIRNPPAPIELGKHYAALIKGGVAKTAQDLAKMLGVTTSHVTRTLALVEKATPKLRAAIAEGQITLRAAETLIARSADSAEMDATVASLIAAADGKTVTRDAADAAKPARSGKKPGRKVKIARLSPEALLTDQTGITGLVRRNGKDDYTVVLTIELPHEGDTFARFNAVQRFQAILGKLEPKTVRDELEAQRKMLNER